MYAPACLSSRASVGSTSERRVVTLFALSRGTAAPQLLQYTVSLLPLPPLDRPLLFLFLDKVTLRAHSKSLFKDITGFDLHRMDAGASPGGP